MAHYQVDETEEYCTWFESQSLKTQAIVAKRIKNIINYGHFEDFKDVSQYDRGLTKDGMLELRWDDEKRVYYGKIGDTYLLLLYGGNKNGQNKDIKNAKKIFLKYVEE